MRGGVERRTREKWPKNYSKLPYHAPAPLGSDLKTGISGTASDGKHQSASDRHVHWKGTYAATSLITSHASTARMGRYSADNCMREFETVQNDAELRTVEELLFGFDGPRSPREEHLSARPRWTLIQTIAVERADHGGRHRIVAPGVQPFLPGQDGARRPPSCGFLCDRQREASEWGGPEVQRVRVCEDRLSIQCVHHAGDVPTPLRGRAR